MNCSANQRIGNVTLTGLSMSCLRILGMKIIMSYLSTTHEIMRLLKEERSILRIMRSLLKSLLREDLTPKQSPP